MFFEASINNKIIGFCSNGCSDVNALKNLRLVSKEYKSCVDCFLQDYILNSLCLFNSPIACSKKWNISWVSLDIAADLCNQRRYLEAVHQLAACFNKTFPGILNSLAPQARNGWEKFILSNELARFELAQKYPSFLTYCQENEAQKRIDPVYKRRKLDVLSKTINNSKTINFFNYVKYRQYLLKSSISQKTQITGTHNLDLSKVHRWENNLVIRGDFSKFFSWFLAAPEEIRRVSQHNFSRMIEQAKLDLFIKSLKLNLINLKMPNDYLHHLARLNSVVNLHGLIRLGANPCQMVNVNFRNKQYITCKTSVLHALCTQSENSNKFEECLNYLITLIPINTQDEDGNTPLHYACKYLRSSFVKLLMKRGANPTIINNKGETIIHFAAMGFFNVRNNTLPFLLNYSLIHIQPNLKGEFYLDYLDLNPPNHNLNLNHKIKKILPKTILSAINQQNEEAETFAHKLARFAYREWVLRFFEILIKEMDLHLLNIYKRSPLDLLLDGVVNFVHGEDELKNYYQVLKIIKKSGIRYSRENLLTYINYIASNPLKNRRSTVYRYLSFLMLAFGTNYFQEIVRHIKKILMPDQKDYMCQVIDHSGLVDPEEAIIILTDFCFE